MSSAKPQKKKPEEIRRAPLKEIEMSPEDWSEFSEGVHLFNAGRFWDSHEAWEQVWKRHTEDERLFFQGLIQLAAAYHHLSVRPTVRGIVNNLEKARGKLEVFQPEYLGVHVTPLVRFIEEGKEEAARLGDGRLGEFRPSLVPKLQFHRPESPDLTVEMEEIRTAPEFLEGITLFNEGYHWEAHEVWEELWRQQEGDAKSFVQALVQAAAAYSFVRLGKPASAVYLFEKSLQKLQDFLGLESPVGLEHLVEDLRAALARLKVPPGNGNGRLSIPAPRQLILRESGPHRKP